MNAADNPAGGAVDPIVLVIMGVSGCGKSTVAALLSRALNWSFEEGDSLHPQANIEKMAAGHPLDDEDRWPWLARVAEWTEECLDAGRNGIISCSSLKRSYRDIINRRGHGVEFVYLAGSKKLIAERLAARHGHFMPTTLLDSQFAALEEPTADEPSIRVEIGASAGEIAEDVLATLHLESQRTGTTR